jgi:hypothetical protein
MGFGHRRRVHFSFHYFWFLVCLGFFSIGLTQNWDVIETQTDSKNHLSKAHEVIRGAETVTQSENCCISNEDQRLVFRTLIKNSKTGTEVHTYTHRHRQTDKQRDTDARQKDTHTHTYPRHETKHQRV